LENFVFKTAKLIAMKLFGRSKRSKKDAAEADAAEKQKEEQEKEEKEKEENENKDDQKRAVAKSSNSQDDGDNEQNNEEIDKMLEEMMTKQRDEKLKSDQAQAATRVEYDSLTEGLDEINFHLPLFFLLVLITVLSLPSTIVWAKNYQYARVLANDHIKISSTIILISLGFIWQLSTPRNV
jgi:hypothetical protein